jgi:hypothetical protein
MGAIPDALYMRAQCLRAVAGKASRMQSPPVEIGGGSLLAEGRWLREKQVLLCLQDVESHVAPQLRGMYMYKMQTPVAQRVWHSYGDES